MNRRLEQFLAAENISQSQFADTIGVARASVSHILAGRNKPGFDFIESMSRHFPSLNIEWLILGTGKMYKSAGANTQENAPAMLQEPDSVNLFDSQEIEENEPADLFSPAPAPLPESPAPKSSCFRLQGFPTLFQRFICRTHNNQNQAGNQQVSPPDDA